jgi:hypothetical protein
LVGALSWPDVVGAASVHEQSCWYLRDAVYFIGDMCPYDVPYEEAEEGPIN